MKTLIQGGYVVAHGEHGHRILQDGVVVYEDDRVVHVGKSYDGPVDRKIDAKDKLVSPGFINMHGWAALDVPLRLDGFLGARWQSKAYVVDGVGTQDLEPLKGDDFRTVALIALLSLLKGGSTTSVTLTAMDPALWESPVEQTELLADIAGKLGARAYISHNYRSAVRYWSEQGSMCYHWNEEAGQAGLAHAIQFAEQYHGAYEDRIRAMLFPYTFECASEELLRETKRAAKERGLIVHMHTAQSLTEFYECLKRYGRTPIQYLYDIGWLDTQTILTHAIYTTSNPLCGYRRHDKHDLELLAKSGATVAHTPVINSRCGELLHSFGVYMRAGINMAIGTDEFPMDMITEMRSAAIMGKIADQDHLAVTARDVFNAATLGGARALGREDLGRLAPGAKADIVIVDLRDLSVGLVDDPIKTLVYMASFRDVETVIIDGKVVVDGRQIPGVDEAELVLRTRQVLQKQSLNIVKHNPLGWSAEEIFRPSFPME